MNDLDDVNEAPVAQRYRSVQSATEYAKTIDQPRMTRHQLDAYRYEMSRQPYGRREMSIDEDFYDGNQLTAEELQQYEDRGIPAVTVNLVGPTVDLLLGMEAKSRTDWLVRPESGGQADDLALAMSERLSTAEKQTKADDACSAALARQIIAGLGVVEVGYESDPFKYPHRVRAHDWREFRIDPLSVEDDLTDARYLKRSKFFDRSELVARFKDKAQLIAELGTGNGWHTRTDEPWDIEPEMMPADGQWRDYSLRDMEWFDAERDRLMLEEVWYRVFIRGEVMRLPDGTAIRFDEKNPVHAAAVEAGKVKLIEAAWSEMRCAYFIGPLRLLDMPTPYPHREFPYVFFWGQREGRTKAPYGVVRRMRPMQREINARRSKMMWALSAKRITVTKGMVDDIEELRIEGGRADALFELNNVPNGLFKVDDNAGISDPQYKVMVDSIQRLQDVAGVYNSQLGKKDGGADSGVAINQLIEQGGTTVAPLFNKFKRGRTQVGNLLLSLELAALEEQRNVPVRVQTGTGRKTVYLNKPIDGPVEGIEALQNNVASAKLKVTLDDVPSSATFRQQQFDRIAEIIGSIQKVNPEAAFRLLDLLVDASDVPNKQEFVDRIREILGMASDPESMTPEQQAEAQAKADEAAAQKALERRAMEAEVAEKEGKAKNLQGSLEKMIADIGAIAAKVEQIQAQTAKTIVETEAIEQDMADQAAMLAAAPVQKSQAVLRW